MTLDEFILSLTQLRDHYNAGDFTVMTEEIEYDINCGEIQEAYKNPCPMDGDDYWLDIEQKQVRIATKGDGNDTQKLFESLKKK